MHLHVVTPGSVVVDAPADKVSTEAVDGSFTLLPRHVDMVAALVPGLLTYVLDGVERLVAIDGGILVKRDRSVRVATGEAIPGDDAADLQRALSASMRGLERRRTSDAGGDRPPRDRRDPPVDGVGGS